MTTYRPHFDQRQPGIVRGYEPMTQPIKALEAKCRDAIDAGYRIDINPKLILQLIEERRLLARLAMGLREITDVEWQGACELRDRVLQEIAECKS